MHGQTIETWLDELASDAPAPGGGAAAAMSVAMGAALVEMVCNLTVGRPRYAEYEPVLRPALARATEVRARALALAAADAEAFSAVMAAYKLPKESDADKHARTAAIQAATVVAAEVPLEAATLAHEVIGLSADILDGANVNVLSDVAVAAASAAAALTASVVNVEVNLAGLRDEATRAELRARLDRCGGGTAEAQTIVDEVRKRINA